MLKQIVTLIANRLTICSLFVRCKNPQKFMLIAQNDYAYLSKANKRNREGKRLKRRGQTSRLLVGLRPFCFGFSYIAENQWIGL